MPTLLQINVVANFGSTGRIADEIGEIAIAKGWESYIAFGRNERLSKSKLIKIGSELEIKMHGIKTRLFDRHGFGSKRATFAFVKRIEEINPDVIHLHNIHGYYINVEILFNYLANSNIPVVWTLHDCWPFTGHCAYFDFVGCNKWEDGCFSCPQKREYPASLWIDNSKKNYLDKQKLFNSVENLTIVPVSNWLSDLVNKSFLKNYPLKTINNGINLNVFNPKENIAVVKNELGVNDCFMLLGVASDWETRKGLDDFIKLSKLMGQEFIIVLVGVNDEQIKVLPTNIIAIKRTENISQLVEIYAAADLFLNLTYEDNFPTTNLEALACGTPVITYRTGGSPEALDLETGIVVEKGDIGGLVNAIQQIQANSKGFYSKACVKRARQFYNKDDRFNDYLNLYDSKLT